MQAKTFTTRSGAALSFTPIGLGTAPIGDLYRRLDEGDAVATVRHAHAAGIRLFDSSPHYGNGLAEARSGPRCAPPRATASCSRPRSGDAWNRSRHGWRRGTT